MGESRSAEMVVRSMPTFTHASCLSPLNVATKIEDDSTSGWDLLFRGLRASYKHAHSFTTALGVFLVFGAVIAVVCTYAFAKLAKLMRRGYTQAFDDAVLRWMQRHQTPWLDHFMINFTMLGTWLVTLSIVCVAALFLWLTRHKYSAALLLVATAGGIGAEQHSQGGLLTPAAARVRVAHASRPARRFRPGTR